MLRTYFFDFGDEQVCLLEEPAQGFFGYIEMWRIAGLHISLVDDVEPSLVALLILRPGLGELIPLPF